MSSPATSPMSQAIRSANIRHLAAAGALPVGDAARLLRLRGQAMQRAVPVGDGAMAALIGLDVETARRVAAEASRPVPERHEICAVANDNAPGQVVVSGDRDAVERAIAIARAYGATPIRRPAGQRAVSFAADGAGRGRNGRGARGGRTAPAARAAGRQRLRRADREPGEIKRLLVEQVTAMVRWRESVLFLAEDGVEEVVETGAGRVLAGLSRRIVPDLKARSVGTAAEVDAFLSDF